MGNYTARTEPGASDPDAIEADATLVKLINSENLISLESPAVNADKQDTGLLSIYLYCIGQRAMAAPGLWATKHRGGVAKRDVHQCLSRLQQREDVVAQPVDLRLKLLAALHVIQHADRNLSS
jgi:hypothetical protein